MPDNPSTTKVSYPYMTAGQWFGVRERLRKSVPKEVDVDWIMAALGGSEKGARNLLPQLRAVGLVSTENKPIDGLVHDLRDDASYGEACRRVRESVYPPALLDAWNDPDEDADKVAAWFMRNAGTGAATAKMQSRLYLLLLKGELPSAEEAKTAAKKTSPAPAKKAPTKSADKTLQDTPTQEGKGQTPLTPVPQMSPPPGNLGPNLHIDMQIHISADASDTQIDTIFKSMAKHLYGRE